MPKITTNPLPAGVSCQILLEKDNVAISRYMKV